MLWRELRLHSALERLVPFGRLLIGFVAYREIHIGIGHILVVRLILVETSGKRKGDYG